MENLEVIEEKRKRNLDNYNDWFEAKTKLDFWKKKELEIRNKVLEERSYFTNIVEGLFKTEVENLEIKCTYKLGRKLDKQAVKDSWKLLTPEEKECVEFVPTLKVPQYKKLEEEEERTRNTDDPIIYDLIDMVTVKPAQGSLSIKEK